MVFFGGEFRSKTGVCSEGFLVGVGLKFESETRRATISLGGTRIKLSL